MSRRVSRYIPAVLAVLLAQGLATLIYLSLQRHRTKGGDEPFRFENLAPGRSAPELVFGLPDGSTRTLAQLRGKVVLLHFWATWCEPCRKELPQLLALGRELSREGKLEVVAVTLDKDWAAIRKFFDGEIPVEVVQDKGSHAVGLYHLSALPDTYLVSPDGALRLRFGGTREWREDAARDVLKRYWGSSDERD